MNHTPVNDVGTDPTAAPHALLSGGGSGGHVFPGLAIAEELVSRGWRVSWAGSKQGLEARLVARRGIPFHHLPARPVVGQGLLGKARAAATLALSAWRARSLVRRTDARLVIGTGGYVSAPAVIGARLASRPALLLEPNAEPGVANRLLSRLATEVAVAFERTGSAFACPARLTGVPVRAEFSRRAASLRRVDGQTLAAAPPLRLLVLGGSQGARQINQLVPRALSLLSGRLGDVAVRHQTGAELLEETREAYSTAGLGASAPEVVPFIDDMAGAMADSHLIVSRAGAITLAEICAAGRPSLLLPLALAGGHQAGNARRLADAGAAATLPEPSAEALATALGELLGDVDKLEQMASRALSLGRPNAAAAIADRAERLAGGRPAGSSDAAPDAARQADGRQDAAPPDGHLRREALPC